MVVNKVSLYDSQGLVSREVIQFPQKMVVHVLRRSAIEHHPQNSAKATFESEPELVIEDPERICVGLPKSAVAGGKGFRLNDHKAAAVLIPQWQAQRMTLVTGDRIVRFRVPDGDEWQSFVSARDISDPWRVALLGLKTVSFPLLGSWIDNELVPRHALLRPHKRLHRWCLDNRSVIASNERPLDMESWSRQFQSEQKKDATNQTSESATANPSSSSSSSPPPPPPVGSGFPPTESCRLEDALPPDGKLPSKIVVVGTEELTERVLCQLFELVQCGESRRYTLPSQFQEIKHFKDRLIQEARCPPGLLGHRTRRICVLQVEESLSHEQLRECRGILSELLLHSRHYNTLLIIRMPDFQTWQSTHSKFLRHSCDLTIMESPAGNPQTISNAKNDECRRMVWQFICEHERGEFDINARTCSPPSLEFNLWWSEGRLGGKDDGKSQSILLFDSSSLSGPRIARLVPNSNTMG